MWRAGCGGLIQCCWAHGRSCRHRRYSTVLGLLRQCGTDVVVSAACVTVGVACAGSCHSLFFSQ
jgi:hypothetical protein